MVEERCRSCKGFDLVLNAEEGDMICRSCGLVTGWQHLDSRESMSRDGGGSLESTWGVSGKILKAADRQGLNKAAAQCEEVQLSKRFLQARDVLSQLGGQLVLPFTVVDGAARGLERLDSQKRLPGVRGGGRLLGVAALYHACREEGIPRTFDELAAASGISRFDIGRAHLALRKLHAQLDDDQTEKGGGKGRGGGHGKEDRDFRVVFKHFQPPPAKLSKQAVPIHPVSIEEEDEPERKEVSPSYAPSLPCGSPADVAPLSLTEPPPPSSSSEGQGFKRARITPSSDVDVPAGKLKHAPTLVTSLSPESGAAPIIAVDDESTPGGVVLPQQLVPRFSRKLRVPPAMQSLAEEIASRLHAAGLLEVRRPQVQAAAALFLAHFFFPKFDVDKKRVAKACSVSMAMLEKVHRGVRKEWRVFVPPDTQAKIGASTLSELFEA